MVILLQIDSRAFRLQWPTNNKELDQPKNAVLPITYGREPNVGQVAVDLRDEWQIASV